MAAAMLILFLVIVLGPVMIHAVRDWDEVVGSYERDFKRSNNGEQIISDQVCGKDYSSEYQHVVYIDPKRNGRTADCDNEHFNSKPSVTCSDINKALSFHADSTAYVLASAANTSHYLKQDTGDSNTFFEGLSHMGFFGQTIGEVAEIECLDNAGLAFWNSNQVRIEGVQFSKCGALRKSTSNDFSKKGFYLLQTKVALYFYNGSDVTMCHVTVQNGVDSLGVMMYDTNGIVNVFDSNFNNNTLSSNFTRPGGGGFGVEFSFCVPGDQECTDAKKQTTHNANSNYTFFGTNFVRNAARTTAAVVNQLTVGRFHESLGRGGGLSLYFTGSASGNSVQIISCKFVENSALWGGGLEVAFKDTCVGNSVVVQETLFFNNTCYTETGISGGGLRILSLLYFEQGPMFNDSVLGNKVTISGYFVSNLAKKGGAISYSPVYQKRFPTPETTTVRIFNSVFEDNEALLGAAFHAEVYPLYVTGLLNTVVIENSQFISNTAAVNTQESSNYDIGIGVVYTFRVHLHFLSEVVFSDNYGTALAVISSHAAFHNSSVSFVNNRGDTGGGIAFLEASHAIVNDNTSILFENNVARVGGAIYNVMMMEGVMRSSVECFIQYHKPLEDREKWKANFTFINNTANGWSNSIYSTSVYPCARRNTKDNSKLNDSLLFCINDNWSFVGSHCNDQIETQGNVYTFQNKSTLFSFPGHGLNLPIAVFGDLNHDITSSVGYTSTISNDSAVAQVDPKFSLTSGNFLSINGLPNSTVHLELQSTGSRPHRLRLDVELLQCPPGFSFSIPELTTDSEESAESHGQCNCKPPRSFLGNLNCSTQNFEARIPWYMWMGIDPTSNDPDQLLMSGIPNTYSEQDNLANDYYLLPKSYAELDETICGTRNRAGPICGRCKENYSTSVNSIDYICTLCEDDTEFAKNIAIFMVSSYLPYIFLLGAVVYFNLKLTSSATNGFILFAQMMSLGVFTVSRSSRIIGIDSRMYHMHKAYHFVYGLFNFNCFANMMKPFCISKNFTTFDVLLLEYTLAALPLLVIVFLYFLLRCKSIRCRWCCKRRPRMSGSLPLRGSRSRGRKKTSNNSMVHAFVAFVLLSYTKLSSVSVKMITVTQLFDEHGNYLSNSRLFLAGHMTFFSREYFLPYGIVAFSVVALFVVLPPLFLLGLPQLVDRLLDKERFSCLRRVWPTVTIHIYLDAFQGFYKPNRYSFAGVYFVFRLAILILYASTNNHLTMYILQEFFILSMIALLGIFKPYKREVFNIVDILIFLNLGIINLISTYVYASSLTISGLAVEVASTLNAIQYCLLWLPLVYMVSYLVFKLLIKLGIYQRIAEKVQQHRTGSAAESLRQYFTDNSDLGDGSETEEHLSDVDSHSDEALFSRAKLTNMFRPPASHSRQRHMNSVVDQAHQRNSEFETESTDENGTNSTE